MQFVLTDEEVSANNSWSITMESVELNFFQYHTAPTGSGNIRVVPGGKVHGLFSIDRSLHITIKRDGIFYHEYWVTINPVVSPVPAIPNFTLNNYTPPEFPQYLYLCPWEGLIMDISNSHTMPRYQISVTRVNSDGSNYLGNGSYTYTTAVTTSNPPNNIVNLANFPDISIGYNRYYKIELLGESCNGSIVSKSAIVYFRTLKSCLIGEPVVKDDKHEKAIALHERKIYTNQNNLIVNYFDLNENEFNVNIYSIEGRLMLQENLIPNQVNEIPIQDLPAGIYIAHLQTTSGMQAFKFVKN